MSRWSQTWLPVVMQSTPALCSSAQILAVMPKPAAAFSPLAMTKYFVIANGENAAAGFGITAKICAELHNAGVDCITTGNHVWDQRDIVGYIAQDKRLLRPLNFPPGTPGWGANQFST